MPQSPDVKQARRIIREQQPTLEEAQEAVNRLEKDFDEAWNYYFYALDVAKTGSMEDERRIDRAYNMQIEVVRKLTIAKIVLYRIQQGLADRD